MFILDIPLLLVRSLGHTSRRRPVVWCHFKAVPLERWSDLTSNNTPVSEWFCCPPRTCRNDQLELLSCQQIAPNTVLFDGPALSPDRHLQRRAAVIAHDFGSVESVPVTALAGLKQVIDTGYYTTASVGRVVPIDLSIMTALNMGNKPENADKIIASHASCHPVVIVTSTRSFTFNLLTLITPRNKLYSCDSLAKQQQLN